MSDDLVVPRFYIVNQHIGWLKQYMQRMESNNWRDMRDYAERQIESMSAEIDRLETVYATASLTDVVPNDKKTP